MQLSQECLTTGKERIAAVRNLPDGRRSQWRAVTTGGRWFREQFDDKLFNNFANAFNDIQECGVLILPQSNGSSVPWQSVKLGKREISHIRWSQEDRDKASFPMFMSTYGCLHHSTIAVIGCDKIWADQEQNNIRETKVFLSECLPLVPWVNLTIMPTRNDPLSFQT